MFELGTDGPTRTLVGVDGRTPAGRSPSYRERTGASVSFV